MTKKQDISDEQLVAQYVNGSDQAFEKLVDRYHKQIYIFVMRFLGNRELAEDVTQEIFIRLSQAATTFDVTKRFKPWIFTVAANKARDALRSAGRSVKPVSMHASQADEDQSLIDILPSDQARPEMKLIDNEKAERVKEAVQELPDNLREVLLLAYYEQLQYKEIAEILGIPLGTVKSRLHKAVKAFGQIWRSKHGDKP